MEKINKNVKRIRIWNLVNNSELAGSLYIYSKEDFEKSTQFFNSTKFDKGVGLSSFQPLIAYNLSKLDINKLTFFNRDFPIVSKNAKRIFLSFFHNKIEFLTLIHDLKAHKDLPFIKPLLKQKEYQGLVDLIWTEPHYLLNILDIKTADVLDKEASVFEWNEETGKIDMIERLVFKEEAIQGSHLFKIMGHGQALEMMTFMSDELRKVIEENGLTGLEFLDHPTKGNLVWDSEAPHGREPELGDFSNYLTLEAQNFIDYFARQEENKLIRAFGVQYDPEYDSLFYGFIDQESFRDMNISTPDVSLWPYSDEDFEDFKHPYRLVEDFIEDFQDDLDDLEDPQQVAAQQQALQEQITKALQQLNFSSINKHPNFEIIQY